METFNEILEETKQELGNYRKVIKLFQQFEHDLKEVDNMVTETVAVSTLIQKPFKGLVNLMNTNSARLKQKQSVEAKIDMLDENIKILASLFMKQRSQNHSN